MFLRVTFLATVLNKIIMIWFCDFHADFFGEKWESR